MTAKLKVILYCTDLDRIPHVMATLLAHTLTGRVWREEQYVLLDQNCDR